MFYPINNIAYLKCVVFVKTTMLTFKKKLQKRKNLEFSEKHFNDLQSK